MNIKMICQAVLGCVGVICGTLLALNDMVGWGFALVVVVLMAISSD